MLLLEVTSHHIQPRQVPSRLSQPWNRSGTLASCATGTRVRVRGRVSVRVSQERVCHRMRVPPYACATVRVLGSGVGSAPTRPFFVPANPLVPYPPVLRPCQPPRPLITRSLPFSTLSSPFHPFSAFPNCLVPYPPVLSLFQPSRPLFTRSLPFSTLSSPTRPFFVPANPLVPFSPVLRHFQPSRPLPTRSFLFPTFSYPKHPVCYLFLSC